MIGNIDRCGPVAVPIVCGIVEFKIVLTVFLAPYSEANLFDTARVGDASGSQRKDICLNFRTHIGFYPL